jgi:hypothetical protein
LIGWIEPIDSARFFGETARAEPVEAQPFSAHPCCEFDLMFAILLKMS